MNKENKIILDFSDYDKAVIKNKIIELKKKENSRTIHALWSQISDYYHTKEESEFILNLLVGAEEKNILDPSFGSGYPLLLLKRNQFENLYASDIKSNNLLEQICRTNEIKYFSSSFKDLKDNSLRKNFDIIIVIGASLSYCQSWDTSIKNIKLDINELFESIKGLGSVLNENGTLYVGNAKIYHSGNNEDNLIFYDTNGELRMRWQLIYNWNEKKKRWLCKFYKDSSEEKFKIELESHLFSNDMLIEYCRKFFKEVQLIKGPDKCPEDIIKCCKYIS
ncbi:MAG: hypothetical protein LWX07_04360 [Bacteroidetes bacterium]|nr:hypothetical protein [Bacteroidota bacterium]